MKSNKYKIIKLGDLWNEGVINKIQKLGNFIIWFEETEERKNIGFERIDGIATFNGVRMDIKEKDFDEYSRILLDSFTSLDVYTMSWSHYYLKINDPINPKGRYIINRKIKIPMDLWKEYEEYKGGE